MAQTLPRDLLAEAFPDKPRLVAAFEQVDETVAKTTITASAAVAATDELNAASFIVLSENAALTNERILAPGTGIVLEIGERFVGIKTDPTVVATVNGGFNVVLTAQQETNLVLPISGHLATRQGVEILSNKTLSAPKLAAVPDYADDTAAAAGGVPLGGMYRTGNALKVRIA